MNNTLEENSLETTPSNPQRISPRKTFEKFAKFRAVGKRREPLYSFGVGQSALAAVAADRGQVIADYADVVPSPSAVDPAQDPLTLWGAEQAVLCLVNQERAAAGISALAWSDELEGAA